MCPGMITLISVSRATLLRAQSHILGCESCSPDAQIPFDWVLDDVTGFSGAEVDYVLLSEVLLGVRSVWGRLGRRLWWRGDIPLTGFSTPPNMSARLVETL